MISRSLGVKDLLDARDQFHVHLAHKPNVFSTAIGLYLIRTSDPDSRNYYSHHRTRRPKASPRTLLNTVVKDWSWPCILVFVTEWLTLNDLRPKPDQVIPPFVYMPDGRMVPICVVLAESSNLPPRVVAPSTLTARSLGIGCPIYVDAQGMRRMGTAACMVSDMQRLLRPFLAAPTSRASREGRCEHSFAVSRCSSVQRTAREISQKRLSPKSIRSCQVETQSSTLTQPSSGWKTPLHGIQKLSQKPLGRSPTLARRRHRSRGSVAP